MNRLTRYAGILLPMTGWLALPIEANAAQPPDVVTSPNGFTAMGSGALLGLTTGYANTAAGANTMMLTTTGSLNTALGNLAMYSNTVGRCFS